MRSYPYHLDQSTCGNSLTFHQVLRNIYNLIKLEKFNLYEKEPKVLVLYICLNFENLCTYDNYPFLLELILLAKPIMVDKVQ